MFTKLTCYHISADGLVERRRAELLIVVNPASVTSRIIAYISGARCPVHRRDQGLPDARIIDEIEEIIREIEEIREIAIRVPLPRKAPQVKQSRYEMHKFTQFVQSAACRR